MSRLREQQYHHGCVQELHGWIVENSITTSTQPAFLPFDSLSDHLESNNLEDLDKLLVAVYADQADQVNAKRIASKYSRVFCVLLEIGKLNFLPRFLQLDDLSDKHLPFTPEHKPNMFPWDPNSPNFYADFCSAQWRFFPPQMDYMSNQTFNKNSTLPFTHKTLIAEGGNSKIYKIEISAYYNNLLPSSRPPKDIFALKEYCGKDAEKAWTREVDAFMKFQRRMQSTNVIEFYCAFKHGDGYNIILEYADRGSLEEYLQVEDPPVDARDITKFWEGIFGLLRGLRDLHDGELSIWHQDVKPENILVLSSSNPSPYYCEFKLADLGTSHSKPVFSPNDDDTDRDTHGTQTYGAPECYRSDSRLGEGNIRVKLKVDIWSLGCILSELAVWVAGGKQDLKAYRNARYAAIQRLPGLYSGDYFHNGMELLPTVKEWHDRVNTRLGTLDVITSKVLHLIEEMLRDVRDREEAHYFCTMAHTIYAEASENLPQPPRHRSEPAVPPHDIDTSLLMKSNSAPLNLIRTDISSSTQNQSSRPTTRLPLRFPPASAARPERQAPPAGKKVPPYMSFAEAMRWHDSLKQASRIPKLKPSTVSLRDKWALNVLDGRDMIFIIDDAESMRPYWPEVTSLFHILAYMIKHRDPDGLDLYFTSSNEKFHDKHTSPLTEVVRERMGSQETGSSDMSIRLEHILRDYVKKLKLQGGEARPLNVYVFTDGVWTPHCNIVPEIDFVVKTMKNLDLPENKVGLQFISFGDEKDGMARLNLVDNYLELFYDIVDTTPSTGNLYKMIRGASDRWFDENEPTSTNGIPAR